MNRMNNTPIGRVNCPHCNKDVPVTPTENYWWHSAADSNLNTKGHRNYACMGSGEPLTSEHRQELGL